MGRVAALALLLAFCAAIALAMVRGKTPDCHCFGQLHSAPVGWKTLVRNGLLAAAAACIVVAGRDDPGADAFAWASALDSIEWLALALAVTLAAVVAIGGYALTHVMRSYGRVLVRLERIEEGLREAGFELDDLDVLPRLGLEPGTPAPTFWLPTHAGDRIALDDLLQPGRPALLVFTSPGCGPCSTLMPTIVGWQREHADDLIVALLSGGDADVVRAEAAEHGLVNVLIDGTLSAYEDYEAGGTPSAVLVGDDGRIASWLAAGVDSIELLVEQALGGLGRTPGLPVGAEAPSVELDRLDGGRAGVTTLGDGPTVVLFWNPGCGFCRAMHGDVRAWEQERDAEAPALVVVSSGDEDEVRAEGFDVPVLLDPGWELAGAFGADGTPMAVLLDGEGRIAGPLVTGAEAVIDLLGATRERVA